MKPYYYIHLPGGRKPAFRHSTLADATTESQRLAAKHPGDEFEILMCIGITRTTTPATFWMDGVIGPRLCEMHLVRDEMCLICGEFMVSSDDLPNA